MDGCEGFKNANIMSTTTQNLQGEVNKFQTSSIVKNILHEKGFSFLFNWADYEFYKNQCKNAFNKAYSIAEKFLEQAEQDSDFNQYPF